MPRGAGVEHLHDELEQKQQKQRVAAAGVDTIWAVAEPRIVAQGHAQR